MVMMVGVWGGWPQAVVGLGGGDDGGGAWVNPYHVTAMLDESVRMVSRIHKAPLPGWCPLRLAPAAVGVTTVPVSMERGRRHRRVAVPLFQVSACAWYVM